jgi:hypothetical protein
MIWVYFLHDVAYDQLLLFCIMLFSHVNHDVVIQYLLSHMQSMIVIKYSC